MRPTYLRLFNFEIMIEPTSYAGLSYTQESLTERELQIGKIRVLISKVATSASKFVWERF